MPNDPTPCHVLDRDGKPVYNYLLDSGENAIPFRSGSGWVDRDWIESQGMTVEPGWRTDERTAAAD